jgi:hypothetical protein
LKEENNGGKRRGGDKKILVVVAVSYEKQIHVITFVFSFHF